MDRCGTRDDLFVRGQEPCNAETSRACLPDPAAQPSEEAGPWNPKGYVDDSMPTVRFRALAA